MSKIFGTDGARGIANTEISCELAMNIARAAAMVVEEDLGKSPTFIIGKDTRISSDMLESATVAGLCSVGANAVIIGVVPTPAVAYLISKGYADAGIMLSASHNSYEFNGIKVFGSSGYKLTEEQEFEVEAIVLDKVKPYAYRWNYQIGRISYDTSLVEHYKNHLTKTISQDLSGFKVALDCSNGSASTTTKDIFTKLGIKATLIHDNPNGININDNCGSTHIERLVEFVRDNNFDAGFAFDGDADRCMAVDEKGNIIDGDKMLAILSLHLKSKGALKDNMLVATVMSNLGLFRFAEEHNIDIEQTKVGDKYVLQNLQEKKLTLGGEQSGHIILYDYMMTGDGQLTALHILDTMKESDKKLSELGGIMTTYPQVIKNIRADNSMKKTLDIDKGAKDIVEKAQKKLGKDGRILVRASGTEPLIRVMIEGKNKEEIEAMVEAVADKLHERLLAAIN